MLENMSQPQDEAAAPAQQSFAENCVNNRVNNRVDNRVNHRTNNRGEKTAETNEDRDVYKSILSRKSVNHRTLGGVENPSPRQLLVSTLAMSLLGLGIVSLVGALFSSSPWWPLESMHVATSYLALTLSGLVLLVLLHGASVNYVHGNRKTTAAWTGILLVVVAVVALFVAFTHPTLSGSINLGAPRVLWLVLGIVLLAGGAALYRPASRTQRNTV